MLLEKLLTLYRLCLLHWLPYIWLNTQCDFLSTIHKMGDPFLWFSTQCTGNPSPVRRYIGIKPDNTLICSGILSTKYRSKHYLRNTENNNRYVSTLWLRLCYQCGISMRIFLRIWQNRRIICSVISTYLPKEIVEMLILVATIKN